MKQKIGLWIDHRKSIVVTLSDTGEVVEKVASGVERQLSRTGATPRAGSYPARAVAEDDHQKRAFIGHLNIYYDALIAKIHDAEAILIFGPAEAKDDLQKRLEENHYGDRIVGVQAAGRMTTPQIAAKVREFFKQ